VKKVLTERIPKFVSQIHVFISRLQWAGHVQRLPLNHITIKAVKAEFTGS